MEDWAEIRRLYRSEKLSQAAIARRLSLSRNTVAKAISAEAPPHYERGPSTTSAWGQIELAVRVLLGQSPTTPATVLAQRARATGWCICPVSRCSAICGALVPDHAGVLRSFPVLVMVAA